MLVDEYRAFVRFAGNARDVSILIDAEGTILAATESVLPLLGYRLEETLGTNITGYVHVEDLTRAANLLADAPVLAGRTETVEVHVVHAGGHSVLFEFLPLNRLADDGVIVLTGRDITERKRLQDEAQASELQFKALAVSAPIAIFRLDRDARCEFVNERWTELTGQSLEDAVEFGWLSVVDHHDQLKFAEVRDGNESSGVLNISLHIANGSVRRVVGRWTELTNDAGIRTGYVGTMEDVTEQMAMEALLMHQATHDSLTGLPNRVVLHEHLTHHLALCERTGERIAVIFIDLDRFKMVNDSLGHDVGDRLLEVVANRLRSALRTSDVVGRFGGDEFVVIASGESEHWIRELSARVQGVFSEPFALGTGAPYACTASVGIALSESGSSPETLMRDADVAMYRAKELGRGRVEQFDARLRIRAVERLALESDLRRAVENKELVVLYQPIVHSHGEELAGVEALVRWEHPTRGLLSPEAFIMIAEETGLILPIGDWILEQACSDLVRTPNVHLSVNLSSRQFNDGDLVHRVRTILQRVNFPASQLTLEITESVLASNFDDAVSILSGLKDLGIQIAVDDFGTGYSSLNYLSKFPVDSLKVDRSFTQGLGSASGDSEIVKSVIALAHALNLTTTAEGVETVGQLSALRSLGCDFSQGYYFDVPVSMAELRETWLDKIATAQ